MPKSKTELLEIYKLHAELADRVSQRREGANRLYVSLLTGFFTVIITLARFGTGEILTDTALLMGGGVLGCLLSLSWYLVIRSYRQLNTGKFAALQELEAQLGYAFFKREWELLERGKYRGKYWKLSVVASFLPVLFAVAFICMTMYALFSLYR